MLQSKEPQVPGRRWRVGSVLALGVLINYFDRVAMPVAVPQLQHDFNLNAGQLGLLLSAFAWTYGSLQIPTGMVLDRFGVKHVGRISAGLWGVASIITALASGYWSLFVARMLLGIAEAPAFPASSKATGYWFPRHERGLATAIFDASQKFGNAVGVPLVAFAIFHFGWRAGFMLTAVFSFIYFAIFWIVYRDPGEDSRLSDIERRYIQAGGGSKEGVEASSAGAMLAYLLRSRKVWGLTIGFAAYGYSMNLFTSWLPAYLVHTMHVNILRSATFTMIPWSCATLVDLAIGGWAIDFFIKRGHDETVVRKTVLICGMLMGLMVFGAVFTVDPFWALFWITLSLCGLASAAPAGWSIPSLIAPRGGNGTVGGIMNFGNSIMGVISPTLTGLIVMETGSFNSAFVVAGVVLLIGISAYVFVLGRIEPVPDLVASSQSERSGSASLSER
ncbi:MFS transporter [Burkholderia sp. 22PA0106]|uniref:MFS transporter n=1 Tax=Burkholderia sp. 22PA0106 TaxID=3237371 RepID=UPI0039C1FF86